MLAAFLIVLITTVFTSAVYFYAVSKSFDENPDYKGDDFLE